MQMLMLMLSAVQLLYPPFLSTLRKRPDIHFVAAVQHYPDWPEYTLSDPARSTDRLVNICWLLYMQIKCSMPFTLTLFSSIIALDLLCCCSAAVKADLLVHMLVHEQAAMQPTFAALHGHLAVLHFDEQLQGDGGILNIYNKVEVHTHAHTHTQMLHVQWKNK